MKHGDARMKKIVLQFLEDNIDVLTSSQRKVADYILKNPTEVVFMTIEQLAKNVGVSVASVMRMAYTLGYTGYAQFQKDLQKMVRSRVGPPTRLEANVRKLGKKDNLLIGCAEVQMNNIKKTVGFLSDETVKNAFKLIFAAKKIYVIGVRGSSSVADFLSGGLNRLGVDCELLIPDSVRLHAAIVKFCQTDLIIAISLPRYAKRTLEVIGIAKSKGANVISVTDGYSSPLALLSDVVLSCAFESLSFHHSEIGAMFIADFLITGVANKDSKRTKNTLEKIEKIVVAIDANVIK